MQAFAVLAAAAVVGALGMSPVVAAGADVSGVPAGTYAVDPDHAYINFTYTHLGFSNPVLRFDDFDVALELDTASITDSHVSVVIDAASIDSGVTRFDEHLTGEDFFDVARHPQITFRSTALRERGSDGLIIDGELTMLGVTRPVQLVARINKAGINPISEKPTVGVSARTTVNRSEWGLDRYVPAVSDEVQISIEAELRRQ